MNWKLLIICLSFAVGISGRPANETTPVKIEVTTNAKISSAETTNLTEKSVTAEALTATTTTNPSKAIADAPTTVSRYELLKKHDIIASEKQLTDENRELKASSNLQLTSSSNINNNNGVGSEITIKESYHHGVAVPLSLEEYEKELAREKDLINKAKKKIAMESSTPKEGISTWILLSGSNDPTTTSRPEPVKPTYRIETEKKPVKNNTVTATTKKRPPVTSSPKVTPKPTQKAHNNNNKLITRVKVSAPVEASKEEEVKTSSTPVSTTTKKPYQTTKKKFTTTRAKPTSTRAPITTTTTAATTTTAKIVKIKEDSIVIDDESDEVQKSTSTTESASFLIMEPKDSEFNLPDDRSPSKATATKKTPTKSTSTKSKKKKITSTVAPSVTNSTSNSSKIKKKTKTGVTKLSAKKPEKPISTQIYNFLAREVMPSVGVGLVGLVVTAGLATYFLGGPLGALRRSYDIANRRDDVAFDRSDDFGNAQDEGEMFGKVIAGMPENSAYRNNLRINTYRQKVGHPVQPGQVATVGQYNTYPQYAQQKYQAQLAQQQQQQYLRYRNADPYYNSYPQQNYVQQPQPVQTQQQAYYQQAQAKSSEYGPGQSIQAATENTQKFNIESVDMTTSEPSSPSYQLDYDDIAQSYFPQRDDTSSQQQMSIEKQTIQEVETQRPQPQYQPQSELRSNEKVTIVNAQSVPSNHKSDGESLPQPEALKMMSHSDEEYQNSIANAILNQQNQQRKQFVVGSVIAENFEDSPASIVPEHGPRRRRNTSEVDKKIEENEIDLGGDDDHKKQAEVEEIPPPSSSEKPVEDNEHESTTQTYDISNGQNNVFQLFRRIVELKLRLGINFLQNATLAFQQYLRGVEERVQASPLFNPYINNTSTNSTMSRKSNKTKVDNL